MNRRTALLPAVLLCAAAAALPGARRAFSADPPHPASVPREQAADPGRNLRLAEPVALRSLKGNVLSAVQEGQTLYLTLRDGGEDVVVQLGPAPYIAGKGVTVSPGDAVEVKGAAAFLASGGKAIVATDLYKGGTRVKLREEDGTPLWGLKGGCRNCKGGRL